MSLVKMWKEKSTKDKILSRELQKKEIKLIDSFSEKVSFGTAGIRGIMGAGTNKINEFTISAAADAYAKYLIKNVKNSKKMGVVIGHDNRHNGKLYSLVSAQVLNHYGIKTYLFENNDMQPTPLISYTVRKMGLAGAINITASHNPKEYNGFKVYTSLGSQLLPEETKKIQKEIENLDPLNIPRKKDGIFTIPSNIIESYKDEVLKISNFESINNLKVVYSPLHGTGSKIVPEILISKGVDVINVKQQMTEDPNFSKAKSVNPEDTQAYKKSFIVAKKHKADAILITDPDADRIGVGVRHQKRYKFLNGNDIATLYTNYLLNKLSESKNLPNDSYIVSSYVSSDLALKIAKKYGVKVIQTHVGFKNIASVIEKTKGTFLFAYEESYGCLINSNISRDKDAIQASIAYVDMISHYKSMGKNLYQILKDIQKEYGIHRTTQITKKLDQDMTRRLLKRVKDIKSIGRKKVSEIQDFKKDGEKLIKVIFVDGSWMSVRPSGTEPKIKVYIQSVWTKDNLLIRAVLFEKDVAEWISENSEEFNEKSFKWSTLFKYLSFISLIIGIFIFVFFVVYSGTNGINKGDKPIITVSSAIFNSTDKPVWLGLISWWLISNLIGAWAMKRTLQIQGQKSKMIHLVIASIMSSIVSFITPFAVGGDAIAYWYMRRKKIRRGALASTLITNTLLYQAKFTLQTVFLISIGWGVYERVFNSGDPQAQGALILFIIGLSWMIFSTTMIFMIFLSRRIQEFIVKKSIKFLEWTRFFMVTDPGSLSSRYMHEFYRIRVGMKRIWANKLFVPEMLFYRLAPMFMSVGAIVLATVGWIDPSVPAGPYLSQIVVADIVGTANSMSLTPGGAGTGEWLYLNTAKILVSGSPKSNETGYSSLSIMSGYDLMTKIIYSWPLLLSNGLITIMAISYESRSIRIEKINKNRRLRDETIRSRSRTRFLYIGIMISFWIFYIFYILFLVF